MMRPGGRVGGALFVVLFTVAVFAGCIERLDNEHRAAAEGHVQIVPSNQWMWVGSRDTSVTVTSELEAAVESGRLGCISFATTDQAPREPMWVFHHLSSYNCRDQTGEPWSLLLGYANGTESADDVFAAQSETTSALRSLAFEALANGAPGNLVGYHVLARMQEMYVDAERHARDAEAEFDRARAAGSFTHSQANATRLHEVLVRQLFAQHLFHTLSVAWDLIEETVTSGSDCTGDSQEPLLTLQDADRILLKHRDALENQSSLDLRFALSGALADLNQAVVSLRFAHQVDWAPLMLSAASDVTLLDRTLGRIAPDADFRLAEGDNVIEDAGVARINATINKIVRSGVDTWAHGHVDLAMRVLSMREPGLEVSLEPKMEALLVIGGTAARTPCSAS